MFCYKSFAIFQVLIQIFKLFNLEFIRVIAVSWKVISDSDTPEKRHNLLEIRTEDSSVLSSSRRAIRVLHFRK